MPIASIAWQRQGASRLNRLIGQQIRASPCHRLTHELFERTSGGVRRCWPVRSGTLGGAVKVESRNALAQHAIVWPREAIDERGRGIRGLVVSQVLLPGRRRASHGQDLAGRLQADRGDSQRQGHGAGYGGATRPERETPGHRKSVGRRQAAGHGDEAPPATGQRQQDHGHCPGNR